MRLAMVASLFVPFGAARGDIPPAKDIASRVAAVRSQLRAHDAPATDRRGEARDAEGTVAQWPNWPNWPNVWRDWPNWRNWYNY